MSAAEAARVLSNGRSEGRAEAHPAEAYQSALKGLRYEYSEGSVSCALRLGKAFASHAGRVHGGFVATLFDEVMGHAAYRASGVPMVTTLLRVRFIEPMLTDLEHRVEVRVGQLLGGVLDVTAELSGATVVATASAKFRPLTGSSDVGSSH